MHEIGCKDNSFKSAEASILVHGCGDSLYPYFYDKIDRRSKIITHPHRNSFVGTKGDDLLKEIWLIDLYHKAEGFLWQYIYDTREISYWEHQGKYILTKKKNTKNA